MCMDLNSHPCPFLDAHLNPVSKSCDDKSCIIRLVLFFVEHDPKVGVCVYFNVNF